MARFGLADDSDEDEALQNTQVPKRNGDSDYETEKGKARADSPPMATDELSVPTRRRRPAANALVEDEQGEYRLAHESRSRRHAVVSDEDEDEEYEGELGSANKDSTRMAKQPTPWASKLRMEPHKLHVMQTSFFRVPEEQAAFTAAAERAGKTKSQKQVDRLLNASIRFARKHSRGSETGVEAMSVDKGQRMSFDDTLDIEPHRPAHKFIRVEGAKSVSAGQEGSYVDAGLAFGRSFRVSWGPGGQLARIGGTTTSSVVTLDTIRVVANNESAECSRSTRLLQVHLKNSTIELDEASVPMASPSRALTFSAFASLFPQHDNSHEAQVWRQGVALFDPLEPRLPSSAYVPPTIRPRLSAIQRRTALCEWLTSTVAPSVAAAVRADSSSSAAQRTFIRMTGYQIEEAVEDAVTNGNVRLAMLLPQAGGDAVFRADLEDQLAIWCVEGADQLIDEAYRKCLALLAGVTGIWKSPKRDARRDVGDINVVKGLDWKRAFGLALWYGEGSEGGEGYERAVEQYERTMGKDGAPIPLPWYKEDPAGAGVLSWTPSTSSVSTLSTSDSREFGNAEEIDALFELLRLSMAATPLERAIYPRAFGPSPLDYRMTWHLYALLSRAMRLKDFSDRQNLNLEGFETGDQEIEGHSETADSVTCSYAAQLEALGQIQEAAFVLLHLEGSDGRKKAVKELLTRQAHTLEEWQILGLKSLRIPVEWIEEALACLSQYEGNAFDAYEHFLKADEQRLAHDIAVNELAPDAVIRGDFSLLRALFEPFDPQAVDDWSFRGKLYIDYADAAQRIPELVAASQEDAVLDATDAAELERLKILAPQLIRLLPDVLRDRFDPRHNAALSEMLSGLLLRFDSIKTVLGPSPQLESGLVDEATRLRHIHGTAYYRFLRSVSAVA